MGLDGSVHMLHYRGYHTDDNHLVEGGGVGAGQGEEVSGDREISFY